MREIIYGGVDGNSSGNTDRKGNIKTDLRKFGCEDEAGLGQCELWYYGC